MPHGSAIAQSCHCEHARVMPRLTTLLLNTTIARLDLVFASFCKGQWLPAVMRAALQGFTKPRLLSQVSNSPPTEEEASSALAALPDADTEARRAREAIAGARLMLERMHAGRPSLAGGKPWGLSRSHSVSILLRSCACAPTWPVTSPHVSDVMSFPGAAASSSVSAPAQVEEVATGTDTSAFYRVCLDAGTKRDIGLGPCRIPERWKGGFTYLLVAPRSTKPAAAPDAAESRSLALLECPAVPEDMAEPEATALRAIRSLFGEAGDAAAFSLQAMELALVEHREALPSPSRTAAAAAAGSKAGQPHAAVRVAVPRLCAPVAGAAAAAESSAAGAGDDPRAVPCGPFGRSFQGNEHVMVVDLDALVRAGAIDGGWGARAGSIRAVEELRRRLQEARTPSAGGSGPGSAGVEPKRGRPRGRALQALQCAEMVGEAALLALLPPAATAVAAAETPRAVAASMEDDPASGTAKTLPPVLLRVPVAVAKAMTDEQRAEPVWWRQDAVVASCKADSGSVAPVRAEDPTLAGLPAQKWASASLRRILHGWQGRAEPSFPQRRQRRVRLYHGTGPGLALRVLREGFRRPTCKLNPACLAALEATQAGGAEPPLVIPRGCDCQMMGFAVYMARRRKAFTYAARRAEPDAGGSVGAVIECDVDMGRVRQACRVPCPCGCSKPFCDHFGTWYSRHGYDTAFVDDNSRPATTTAEWAVADPARVTPVAIILFQTA